MTCATGTNYREPKSSRRLMFRKRRCAKIESNDIIRLLRFNAANVQHSCYKKQVCRVNPLLVTKTVTQGKPVALIFSRIGGTRNEIICFLVLDRGYPTFVLQFKLQVIRTRGTGSAKFGNVGLKILNPASHNTHRG